MQLHGSYESLEPNLSFSSRPLSASPQTAVKTLDTINALLEGVAQSKTPVPERAVLRTNSQMEIDRALAQIGVTESQKMIMKQLGLEIRKIPSR